MITRKFWIKIWCLTLIASAVTACSFHRTENNQERGPSLNEYEGFTGEQRLKQDLQMVNEYKKKAHQQPLTEKEVERMQTYPVYPDGSTRWNRVVGFVESKKDDMGVLTAKTYDVMPQDETEQMQMVNDYYGILGGGVYNDMFESNYLRKKIDASDAERWKLEVVNVWDSLSKLKEPQKEFLTIPTKREEQIELVQTYLRELPNAPLLDDEIAHYSIMPGDKEGNTQWDDLVEFAYNELSGNGVRMQTYERMPTDTDEQLYMMNACRRMTGNMPITKSIFDEEYSDAEPISRTPGDIDEYSFVKDGMSEWDYAVAFAFALSNNNMRLSDINSYHYDYYWWDYAEYTILN